MSYYNIASTSPSLDAERVNFAPVKRGDQDSIGESHELQIALEVMRALHNLSPGRGIVVWRSDLPPDDDGEED